MIADCERHKDRGFSIVEMLLVMAIMTILMAAGSMVTTSVLRSSQLSSDAAKLADELSRASLDSIKMNRSIKFRFYRFSDALTSTEPMVQAFQMLTLDSKTGRYVQIGKIIFLSRGITIHNSPAASTILNLPQNHPAAGAGSGIVTDPDLPTIAPYTYYEFEFRPDGSTNLPKDKAWGIVLAFHEDGGTGEVPRNYRALGINPFTGAIKRY